MNTFEMAEGELHILSVPTEIW